MSTLDVKVANCCISLGSHAGKWDVYEDLQFCFTLDRGYIIDEFRTTMTSDEFKVVDAVVRRAIANKRQLNTVTGEPGIGKNPKSDGRQPGADPTGYIAGSGNKEYE